MSRHEEESAAVEVDVTVIADHRSVIDRFHIEADALAHHIPSGRIPDGVIGHQVDVRGVLAVEVGQRGVVEGGHGTVVQLQDIAQPGGTIGVIPFATQGRQNIGIILRSTRIVRFARVPL